MNLLSEHLTRNIYMCVFVCMYVCMYACVSLNILADPGVFIIVFFSLYSEPKVTFNSKLWKDSWH